MNKILQVFLMLLYLSPITLLGDNRIKSDIGAYVPAMSIFADDNQSTAEFLNRYVSGETTTLKLKLDIGGGSLYNLKLVFPEGTKVLSGSKIGDDGWMSSGVEAVCEANTVSWTDDMAGARVEGDIDIEVNMPATITGNQKVQCDVKAGSWMTGEFEESYEVELLEAPKEPTISINNEGLITPVFKVGEDRLNDSYFQITNIGIQDLEITGVKNMTSPFSLENTLPLVVKNNETKALEIKFSSDKAGLFVQDIEIESNALVGQSLMLTSAFIDDTYHAEDFESDNNQFPPVGWTTEDTGGDKAWQHLNKMAVFQNYDQENIGEAALITPFVDISAKKDKQFLALETSMSSDAENKLLIEYRIDGKAWVKIDELLAPQAYNVFHYYNLDDIDADKIQFRLKAISKDGRIALSNIVFPEYYDFKVKPHSTKLLFPSDNAVDQTIAMDFSWERVLFADGYRFCYGKEKDNLTEIDLGDVTDYALDLDAESQYYWKVVPYNEIGDADYSPISSFKTEKVIPTEWTSITDLNTRLTYNGDNKSSSQIKLKDDNTSFITWFSREKSGYKLRVQHLTAEGKEIFRRNGLLVSGHPQKSYLSGYDIELSEDGGLYIVMTDLRNSTDDNQIDDVTVYKISDKGEFVWGKDGKTITLDSGKDWAAPEIYRNSENQLFVKAHCFGSGNDETSLQKVFKLDDKGGVEKEFIIEGEIVSFELTDEDEFVYTIAMDPASDKRYLFNRLDKDLQVKYETSLVISTDAGFPQGVYGAFTGNVFKDKNDGYFIAWGCAEGMSRTIKYQYIDATGKVTLDEKGVYISSNHARNHTFYKLAYDEKDDKLYFVWTEGSNYKNGLYAKIFAKGESLTEETIGKELMPVGNTVLGCEDLIVKDDKVILFYADKKEDDNNYYQTNNYLNARFFDKDLNINDDVPNSTVRYSTIYQFKPLTDMDYNDDMMVMVWQASGVVYAQNMYYDSTMGYAGSDKSAPEATKLISVDNNTLRVQFNEAIDKVSAEDVSHYAIEGPGTAVVESAELVKAYEVELTVSGMKSGKQKLVLSGIEDLNGNVNDDDFVYTDFEAAKEPSKISIVKAVAKDRVVVRFNQPVVPDGMTEVGNYTINGLTVKKVEVISGSQIVLQTSELEKKSYDIIVKSFKGVFGNVETDVKSEFTYAENTGSKDYFYEDFSGPMPADFNILDLDKNQPITDLLDFTQGWIVRDYSQDKRGAMSTSAYSPMATADDWMITNAITIKKDAYLTWDAQAFDPRNPDGYEVWISTTGNTIEDADARIVNITEEEYVLTKRIVRLADYGFGDEDIYVMFRNNTYNRYVLVIDNIEVFTPTNNDASVLSQTIPTLANVNAQVPVKAKVINKGLRELKSFKLNYQLAGGTVVTEAITGVSMKMLESADFEFKSLLTLPKTKGDYVLKVWTSEPNGVTDENTENDALDVTITVAEGLQQRLVLLEHFTNTGCGPCAAQNPDLEALIAKDGNDKKVLHITYHGNYPSAEDPFYLANVEHNGGRMQYYGISAFPSVIISGQKNTGPSSVTQDDINREYYRPGLCSVEGGYQFMPTTLEIGVELKNTQDFTGRNITMNIIVMESHEYDEAPGSNGEKVFPNVMRSMLTDVTGMELKNLGLDEKNNYRLTYQLPDDMNDDKVKLAYFVQDQDTKEILMADYLAPATGVEDDETYIKTGLWPNPTSDVLNIKSAERIKSVELINMNGKLVKSEVINNQYGYLSLAGLSEGVYLVKLYIEDSVIVKQIIKK